ncbi:MarR family transcriptional regulator [Burkholderia glumae]|uniref:MarR family winged helix-turn-helix transcriptional regulator n=1 Tax=Burkholderia glumae TaxID=337 RepID=UPI0003A55331|nr:MarR family transcriptional regulator [Burkholderia glumae]MCM2492876.1 MarR family transcriptional regulator [Burkholderia glumae]MCM2544436.1 MarR family transcriptional regulator [Burkholderia glumae]MCQ0030791.1 MarR family transcriptional regulator [Burkholderia glumae]MCQ0036679.1 MarR family transcriptional regulator [Burkholderia glumae]MCR1765725.1 MarR family transcriptional regulator [Burkholderia glumae]
MKGSQAGLEQFLTHRLHTMNKLTDRALGELYRDKLGITLPEARVINAVGAFGPFSIMELARRTQLDKSQASRAAEALIHQGLLSRAASEEDGRMVVVALTRDGAALNRKIMTLARRWNGDLAERLSDSERAALERALDKLIAYTRERIE